MSTDAQPGPITGPTIDPGPVAMPVPAPSFPPLTDKPTPSTSNYDHPPPFESPVPPPVGNEKSKRRARREKKPSLLSRVTASLSTLSPGFRVIGYILFGIIAIVFPIGLVAGFGAAHLVIGNAILNAAGLPNYTTQTSAAKIGASGAPILAVALGVVLSCCCRFDFQIESQLVRTVLGACVSSAVSAGSGALGFVVLASQDVPLDTIGDMPTDPLHMARAGALGGAILGPAIMIGMLVFTILITTPMALPLLCGCEYLFARSRERDTDTTHSHAFCMCGATRGDDPELTAEMARMEAMGQRGSMPQNVRVKPYGSFWHRTLMHLGIIQETTYRGPPP